MNKRDIVKWLEATIEDFTENEDLTSKDAACSLHELIDKINNEAKSVGDYWSLKGINMETLDKIIDTFPEDSEASNNAKELMQILTDEAFLH